MTGTLTYHIAQPTREWEWEDANQTCLTSVDGEYEIRQDPVYGYWSLRKSEDPETSIAEHTVLHTLVMSVEPNPNQKDN